MKFDYFLYFYIFLFMNLITLKNNIWGLGIGDWGFGD
jgi:hypothetical protein